MLCFNISCRMVKPDVLSWGVWLLLFQSKSDLLGETILLQRVLIIIIIIIINIIIIIIIIIIMIIIIIITIVINMLLWWYSFFLLLLNLWPGCFHICKWINHSVIYTLGKKVVTPQDDVSFLWLFLFHQSVRSKDRLFGVICFLCIWCPNFFILLCLSVSTTFDDKMSNWPNVHT